MLQYASVKKGEMAIACQVFSKMIIYNKVGLVPNDAHKGRQESRRVTGKSICGSSTGDSAENESYHRDTTIALKVYHALLLENHLLHVKNR